MKICFICETNFHILNCINYVINNLLNEYPDKKIETDIYIRNEQYIPLELIERVKEVNIFSNVYYYKYDSLDFNRGLSGNIRKAYRICSPKKYISKMCSIKLNLKNKNYDYLYIAYLSPFVYSMSLGNPGTKIRYFDDGLGSYVDKVPKLKWWKRDLLYYLKMKKSPWDNSDYIYVYNPSLCYFSLSQNKKKLHCLNDCDDNFIKKIKYIFDYKECNYYNNIKYIFLTQPHILKENDKKNHVIMDLILKNNKMILRQHPSLEMQGYRNAVLDDSHNMWELICSQYISDDNILLGEFSTAQVTPKLIFNKEPWLIFLYKLYVNEYTSDKISSYERTISDIRGLYSNHKKVQCPKTMDELIAILYNIKESNHE